MFNNYLKIALRNIRKHKGYSFINISGLAMGMACFLLILLYVQNELSYDNYNQNADRIYRVAFSLQLGNNGFESAAVAAPVAEAFVRDFPEVAEAVRLHPAGNFIVKHDKNSFVERKVVFADSSLFNVFSIQLLKGNPQTVLSLPNTLILSRMTAKKYFGTNNPLGKSLTFDNTDEYTITGIFEKIPQNSHFHFDIIISLNTLEESRDRQWLNNNRFNTYILLHENADPKILEEKFPSMIEKYIGSEYAPGRSFEEFLKQENWVIDYYLQPLRDIHLSSDLRGELGFNSDIKFIYIFSAISLFILFIACINFMNLSTARSAGRVKEVGIRKVVGSQRWQLITQFLTESMLLSIIACIISIGFLKIALPNFNNLSDRELQISYLFTGNMIASMFFVITFVGLLAGSYPALFISAFKPVNALKLKQRITAKNSFLRNSLVVFQFTISIILIIGTTVVLSQLNYIQNRKLGFNKNRVVILNNAYLLDNRIETFKKEMLRNPQIVNATISGYLPVPSRRTITGITPDGTADNNQSTLVDVWSVDYDYIETMGIKIAQGRDFSQDFLSDSLAVILNKTAVKTFGWNEPLGKKITGSQSSWFTVIGVIEDFHFESLRNTISPLIMFLDNSYENISFRINSDDISEAIGAIEEKWSQFVPGQPFEYSFLDDRFEAIYESEQKLSMIVGIFAGLAIFIACLGLFGLASYMAEQRTKEIGIRKILGASVLGIVFSLSKDFLKWVIIANVIALPVGWYAMNTWLQNFAYRINIDIWIFILAGTIAVVSALTSVGYQAIKAARANPVDSLRYE